MKTLTIGFSKSAKKFAPFSWIIQLAQGTSYSHVYVKWEMADIQEDMIFQASHTLVNYMSVTQFDLEETVIQEFEFQIDDALWLKIRKWCHLNAGKPYGMKGVFGLAYVMILAKFGKKVHNPFNDSEATFWCSELVATLLEDCANLKLPMELEDITPKDIYPMVEGLPKTLTSDS